MADDSPADEAPVTFTVKSSNDAKYTITVPPSITVLDLKQKLSTKEYAELPPERQRLIYSGRVLKDAETLTSYKIKEGHTVHLVKGAESNQRQNPANQGTSSAGVTGTGSAASSGVPSNIAAGTGNNPLAGLTGARYAGFAQLPNSNMFGPDGGMGPPPDPEQMITMLQNPQFASTLNEALQNPQLIDMMIQQNPALRSMGPEVRQMMQSPEFRRMMTDPDALRQMGQMQRMFGGGLPGMGGAFGGGGGNPAFPAPGVTDTTADGGTNRNMQGEQQQQQQPPMNPFAMFGAPPAAGNPFAALFNNPALQGNTPSATPPATSTGGTPANPSSPSAADTTSNPQQAQQQPPNPFAAIMQNAALMDQVLAPFAAPTNPSDPNAAAAPTQQPANTLAALFGPGGLLAGGNPNAFGAAGAGMGGAPPPAPVDNRPPEERYAEQLRQLNDMGFYEFERNVEALRRSGGSVQGAVEYLLTH